MINFITRNGFKTMRQSQSRETKKPKQTKLPAPHKNARFYALADALIIGDLKKAQSLLNETPELLHARNGIGGETVLHFLAVENEQKGVAWLWERGADLNTQTDFGATPLTNAAQLGYAGLCRFLLENGADMAFVDGTGETALSYAAQKAYETNKADAVSLLSLLLSHTTPADKDAALSDDYARDKMNERLTWAAPEVTALLNKYGFVLPDPVLETQTNG